MRSIGFFIIALLLCPLFQPRKTMEGGNIPDSKQSSLVNFKIPFNNFPSLSNPGKKQGSIDTASLKQSSWYADAMKGIQESEYEIKYDAATKSYASPNRQNNLRAFYTGNQFSLLPRNDSADKWELTLKLKGIYAGKNKVYSPANNPVITNSGNNVRFDNNGQFITEYVNSKEGVRQNFIINQQPSGNPQKLSVQLQASKDWFVNQLNKKEIHFAKATKNGFDKKITYNGLKVWDANNKELEASFAVNENKISIDVATQNAVYPITIDPLSTGTAGTPDWTGDDADQVNAYSGLSVASAGDVNGDGYSDVIIGAYGFDDGANTDEGRAFVYYGSAAGLSVMPNSTPDDADQSSAYFGVTVASAGDVNGDGYSDVVITAVGYDEGANADEGRAFVYYGGAAGLSASPNSILDDADKPNAYFGTGAACAGDVNGDGYSDVIIGAYGYQDGSNVLEGRAFVYHGSAAGLSASPDSTPNDANQADARFGAWVASAGDINGDGYSDVIIGAHTYDDGANTDEGRAFVYYGSATGISNSPDSTPDDADQPGVAFGRCVSSAGDVNGDGYSDVIIGAFQYDDGANVDEGRAFVYYGSAAGLSSSPNVILDNADQAGAFFGWGVSGAGDVNGDGYSDVIIGSHFYDDGGNTDEGRAFIYYGSATGLNASPVSIPDDANQAGAFFGWGVAAAGDVNGDGYSDVIIGAPNYDDAPNTDEGRAFVYQGSPNGLSLTPIIYNPPVSQAASGFGNCVNSAGDINSDGYSDVLISAATYDDGNTDEGRVFVYYGHSTGLSATPDVILDDANQDGANFGYSCAGAGDVNGDGYGDVMVGAIFYDGGNTDEGRAYLYYGHNSGLSATYDLFFDDANQDGAGFGSSVAGTGDVNGDGYGDIVIGAYSFDDLSLTNEGRAYVHYGSSAGPSATPSRVLNDANQVNSYFGLGSSGAGDINGDGYSDVIVGASNYNGKGGAFVYYGHASGLSAIPDRILNDARQAGEGYGGKVAAAGDVNGDGYGDIVLGALFYNGEKGCAYMYYGSSTGLSATPVILENNQVGNQAGDRMGYSVGSAGDVNGDGYSDVIIGIPQYDGTNIEQGRVYLYYGGPSGIQISPDYVFSDANQVNEFFGVSVAGAGDINGDGFSDVIVGADHGSWPTVGRCFIYYGNRTAGLQNNLRLYNSDLSTPIQQFNMTEPNLFGAGLYAKSFIGRQKGKLTWQTVRNGNPFPGSPITNNTGYTAQDPAYTNLGLTGIELKHQIAKVFPAKATYIRARVKYDPVTAITGQVYGPWRYPEGFLRGRRDIGSVALPVKFVSFTAVKQNEAVLLKWITTDETAGINYEVQYSTDGINFTAIKTIPAQNSNRSEYEWLHPDPAKGKNYYRIRAIENGKNTFTATRQVAFQSAFIIKLYPNPVKSGEAVTVESTGNSFAGITTAEVLDISGQKKVQQLFSSFNSAIILPLPQLPAGQYILKIINGNTILYAERFLIIK